MEKSLTCGMSKRTGRRGDSLPLMLPWKEVLQDFLQLLQVEPGFITQHLELFVLWVNKQARGTMMVFQLTPLTPKSD